MKKDAVISALGQHRYSLSRIWDEDKGKVLFIMLNPSTANAIHDDPTTIRCINYAKKWGYGGIMIGNIYPFRAKRPRDLNKWINDTTVFVYGAQRTNKAHVQEMAQKADMTICAWGGNHPGTPRWINDLGNLHFLELCKDRVTPKHPLGNLSKDLEPVPCFYF